MACCCLLSSPSLLTLQSSSSAHSATRKLFTFFASWVFYPVMGCFKTALSLMQGTWCRGRRSGVRKTPLRWAQPSTESPCSTTALSDPTGTSQTSAAAERDAPGGSASHWATLKTWQRIWMLENFWKAVTGRERRKASSQVGLIPL